MPILNPKNWSDFPKDIRSQYSEREWSLQAITKYLNVEEVAKVIESIFDDDDVKTSNHITMHWAYMQLEAKYEDEIGYGQYLLTENAENQEFNQMIDSCVFANGEELTGRLADWIMNTDNEFTR